MDNIMFMDGAMTSLLTIQYNLAAGMLAPFAAERPELRPLMQKILDFDVSSVFYLVICFPSVSGTIKGRRPRSSPLTTKRAIRIATRGKSPNGPVGGICLNTVISYVI